MPTIIIKEPESDQIEGETDEESKDDVVDKAVKKRADRF